MHPAPELFVTNLVLLGQLLCGTTKALLSAMKSTCILTFLFERFEGPGNNFVSYGSELFGKCFADCSNKNVERGISN